MKSRFGGKENGQAMVMIAVAMIAMIAMAALVMDGGFAYLERRRVQNAADAAALAGVRALAKGSNEHAIREAINDYALRNGITSPNTNVKAYFVDANNILVPNNAQQIGQNGQVPKAAKAVVVEAAKRHETFFAKVIGVSTMNVVAVAQAGYDAAAKISGLLPMAVMTDTLTYGSPYVLWDSDTLTEGAPPPGTVIGGASHRGWLNFDGGGQSSSDLVNWMTNGYNMADPVPLWINGSPGVKGSVLDAAKKWIGQTVFVPMFSSWVAHGGVPADGFYPYPGNEQRDYYIIGFGAFTITGVVDIGSSKAITGSFVRWVASQDLGGPVDNGVLGFRLTPPVAVP